MHGKPCPPSSSTAKFISYGIAMWCSCWLRTSLTPRAQTRLLSLLTLQWDLALLYMIELHIQCK